MNQLQSVRLADFIDSIDPKRTLIRDQARKPTRFAALAEREASVREPHDARCGKIPIRPPSSTRLDYGFQQLTSA